MLSGLKSIAILILLLVVIMNLIVFEIDRISDVVGILLYERLKLPAVCIFLTLFIECQDYG